MTVNDTNARAAGAAGLGKAPEVESVGLGTRANVRGQTPAAEDSVQLSQLSSYLQATDEKSPVRVAYVEQLRASVAAGQYQIDAQEVGRRMIDDALRNEPKQKP